MRMAHKKEKSKIKRHAPDLHHAHFLNSPQKDFSGMTSTSSYQRSSLHATTAVVRLKNKA
jgi:hypothetical protein